MKQPNDVDMIHSIVLLTYVVINISVSGIYWNFKSIQTCCIRYGCRVRWKNYWYGLGMRGEVLSTFLHIHLRVSFMFNLMLLYVIYYEYRVYIDYLPTLILYPFLFWYIMTLMIIIWVSRFELLNVESTVFHGDHQIMVCRVNREKNNTNVMCSICYDDLYQWSLVEYPCECRFKSMCGTCALRHFARSCLCPWCRMTVPYICMSIHDVQVH